MDAWLILLPAMVLCALMIFTHVYLGLHVLARGIIFIDLALAQVAALGVSIAFLTGDSHGMVAQLYALGATLLAALGFAGLRKVPGKVNREVIIGCVYVVTMALSIVILSRSTQGMEELKSLFNGNILWVSWIELAYLAAAYAVFGLFHAIFFRVFYDQSFNRKGGQHSIFLWEFLFFASFSLVITLAVNLAGVLLVFAFLIIPAFSASLLSVQFKKRLYFGWFLGMIGASGGLYMAYLADLPVGATIVVTCGALPFLALVLSRVIER